MSLNLALKALKSIGLTEMDAKVYVYLSKRGPHGLNDLADALGVTSQQLAFSLETLRTRSMVKSASEPSVKYYAIPLETILDEFAKAAEEQAKAFQANKDELLRVWRVVLKNSSSNS